MTRSLVFAEEAPQSKYRMEKLTGTRQIRNFITYDLEWYPNDYELRIVGVYDGHEYRDYIDIGDFIQHEFIAQHNGYWFFAHAGGLADLPFVLEWMLREGYRHEGLKYNLTGTFSGSAVTALNVRRGNGHWLMLDSLWLLKDNLRNIAKNLGHGEKGGETAEYNPDGTYVMGTCIDPRTGQEITVPKHHIHFYAPFEELRAYNANDCRLLWDAIHEFQLFLLERGGQLQRTYSSCSFGLFRRKYLTEEFDCWPLVNEEANHAYVASRVEVFNRYLKHGKLYDINSSFPYSMTKTLPGKLKRTGNRLPEGEDEVFIAQCEVEVQTDQYLPPLPFRLRGRVFFPTGRWTNWFTGVDLRLLERTGGRIHKVFKCLEFFPWRDMAQFAQDLFAARLAAKQAGNSFHALLLKYVLNGCYGKLSEGELKQGLVINPPEGKVPPREQMYVPGAFVVEKHAVVRQRHLPAAAYITAYSRQWIYDYLAYLTTAYYCDTDSFVCQQEQEIKPEWVGEELGQIKLERLIEDGEFIAPKVYRADSLIKAKGFPKLTLQQWADLIEYKEVELERMARIKELYRMGEITPQDVTVRKGLNPHATPKRFTYADGTTRPWSVNELYNKVIEGSL